MLLFTSGTTGRSKGCMLSHRYGPRQAELVVEHSGCATTTSSTARSRSSTSTRSC